MNELERLRFILEAVEAVRGEQRAYFAGDKSRARLEASRAAERRLDAMLARHRAALETERAPQQGKLPL